MELRVRHIARNVVFNWFGTMANMAVGFFLSPFIVHRLGDVAFGVWGLAISMVNYMGLLDLGMQSSVLRFVSKGHTQKDHQSASDAISAALWVRLQIGGLILVLTIGLAVLFPHLFNVPENLIADARLAVLLIGFRTAIAMSIGVLGGVLSGLNRYDLQNYVALTQTAVRVIGVVAVLRTGHGIVAIAVCEIIAVICSGSVLIRLSRSLYPELRIHLRKPTRQTLSRIWTYSAYAFLTTIAVQLVYQTDNLVVGAYVSTAAVTFYMIANSLCSYVSQVVGGIGATFVPAASTYEAAGDTSSLVNLYRHGTQITLAISMPILATLILRGPTFIGLWMGPRYSHMSGTILVILAVPLIFSYANRTASSIAFGVEKHKTGAIWAIAEGVANLTLSILLVHRYGIYGVALGTMIPSLFMQLVLWPGYISKLVGLNYFEVVGRVWGPVLLASLPFAIATYAVDRFFPAYHLATFFFQVFATLPVFAIAIGLVFRSYVRDQLLPRARALLFA